MTTVSLDGVVPIDATGPDLDASAAAMASMRIDPEPQPDDYDDAEYADRISRWMDRFDALLAECRAALLTDPTTTTEAI